MSTKNAQPGFESALTELEQIVRQLEQGKGDLEGSIALFERGVALKKICEEKLREARARIEKITVSADGAVKTEPFEE